MLITTAGDRRRATTPLRARLPPSPNLLADLPNAKWDVPTRIFEGDVLFIKWNAVSASTRATDDIDTFVFTDDGIRVQTVRYTLETMG